MNDRTEIIAQAFHEAVRAIQIHSHGQEVIPHWENAPAWMRNSTRDSVRATLAGQTPEQLWETWKASKTGWVYGKVKDANATPPTHPCLVDSYDQLPESEQVKDRVLAALARVLA